MKAWRLEAVQINVRRKAGSKAPKSRVQMHQRDKGVSRGCSNWLLDGLLLHAGFKAAVYDDHQESLRHIPVTQGYLNRLRSLLKAAGKWVH